ncbi:putative Zinc finger protein [Naja naja]|nr:putative Zinc finger protein [Naja naja]
MAALDISPEQLAHRLAEAEALLAARVSEPVQARWRWAVKLDEPPDLERFCAQLSQARRGREALLARDAVLSEAEQERLQGLLRLEMALLRGIQALEEGWAERGDELPLQELRPLLEKVLRLVRKERSWPAADLERAVWTGPLQEEDAQNGTLPEVSLEGSGLGHRSPQELPIESSPKDPQQDQDRLAPGKIMPADLKPHLPNEAACGLQMEMDSLKDAPGRKTEDLLSGSGLGHRSPQELPAESSPKDPHQDHLAPGKIVPTDLKPHLPNEVACGPQVEMDAPSLKGTQWRTAEDLLNAFQEATWIQRSNLKSVSENPKERKDLPDSFQKLLLRGISHEDQRQNTSIERPVELLTQVLVLFEEVAVHFSDEEWSRLNPDQKALHKEVMLENSRNVAFSGIDIQDRCTFPPHCCCVQNQRSEVLQERTILCNYLLVWLAVSSNQKKLSSSSAKQGVKKQRKNINLDLKRIIIKAHDEGNKVNIIVQGEGLAHSTISATISPIPKDKESTQHFPSAEGKTGGECTMIFTASGS